MKELRFDEKVDLTVNLFKAHEHACKKLGHPELADEHHMILLATRYFDRQHVVAVSRVLMSHARGPLTRSTALNVLTRVMTNDLTERQVLQQF